jgi:hypothetical protein
MNFRNISSWCIRNPVPPIVLFIGLLLAGLLSFMTMDVNNNPDIDFPAAQINIVQPGAAPTEMENQVTQRVEAAVRGVSGVDEINSSVREGNSNTFVQFVIGTNTDRAVNDVRDAISQIRGDLPDGILEPQVERIDVAGDPILYVAAETSDMSLEELSWYVDNDVTKDLLGVEGIAAVTREGGVASCSIRSRCRRRESPRRRSTPSCARPISTRRAAAPKSLAQNKRCACLATPRTPINCRRPRSPCPAAGRSASATSPRSRTPIPSSAPSPR